MARSPQDPNTYVSCVKIEGRGAGDVYALLVSTNEERSIHYSRIFKYSNFPSNPGIEVFGVTDWIVDFVLDSRGAIVCISANGAIYRGVADDVVRDKVTESPLFKLCGPQDSGAIVAVGFDGTVFVRSEGGWVDANYPDKTNLFGVSAASNNDFYVCGMGGELSHFDGKRWEKIETQSDLNLMTITHDNHGNIAVAGSSGIVLFGSIELGFETFESGGFDITGSCLYQGKILLSASGYGIYQVDVGGVVDFQKGPKAFRISSNGKWLHASEDDFILVFNGSTWLQLPIFD